MTVVPDRRTAVMASLAAVLSLAGLAVLVTGTRPAWALALVLAGVALLAVPAAVGRKHVLGGLVALGVAASCWDAVRIGGASLFDALCAVGLLVVAVDLMLRRGGTVPWPARPCLVAFGGFALATALVAVFPPDSFYMKSRFELSPMTASAASSLSSTAEGMTDLGGLARLAIGVLALPVVLGWFARERSDLVLVGRAFVAGAAVSNALGLTDHVGLTAVGEMLLGFVDIDNRSTGLTSQPNHLALTGVMALPFVWLTVRQRPVRVVLMLVLLAGIFVSGSRAGLVGAAVALLACAAWRYRARFVLLSAPIGVAVLMSVSELLSYTRFGTEGASASDSERTMVLNQGVDDFAHSPLFGVGLRVSQEAHVIYLQLLASVGLIGMVSFGILFGAALTIAYRLRSTPVTLAAGVSLISFLVVGAASNALLTRYLFVPLVILFVAGRLIGTEDGAAARRSEMDSMVPLVETPGVRGR